MARGLESTAGAFAVDGLTNVRDLGCLPLRGGRMTPSGVFFRSENVDAVTAEGWEQIYAAGIRTVVDLRQPGERARDVRPRPAWLTTRQVDLDGLENREFWKDFWGNGFEDTALALDEPGRDGRQCPPGLDVLAGIGGCRPNAMIRSGWQNRNRIR